MDNRAQVREFLISRRERISPAQAGLPAYGGSNRRVKGLRREEVALLAGVSIDYYVRMERGNLTGASEAVLDGIASALQLDEAERAHLFDLARAAQPAPPRQRRRKTSGVTDGIQQILDAITDAPAWVRNARKCIHHPVVGTLDLNFEAMEFPAHPGLTLLAYTAAAGTPTADSLKMLASWAATAEQAGDLPAHA